MSDLARGDRSRRGRRLRLGVLALALAPLLGACVSLIRPELPWARLEARYANAASRWMDLPGGVRVHYRDQGRREGPPLVLVHGFSASLIDWEPWVQALGDEYRIITLDLPGHGLTRAPPDYARGDDGQVETVRALAGALGLHRFTLAGNSMGGAVAWRYALAHPEQLDALVLVDAAGFPLRSERRSRPFAFTLLASPVGRFILKRIDSRPLAERGLKTAFLDERLVTPELVDRYVAFSRAPGHAEILLSGPTDLADPARLATIRTPTLVMHGRDDRIIPFAAGEGFARAIPGALLIAYDHVGHVPMEQIPDRSAADLRAFLHARGIAGSAPATEHRTPH